MANEEKQVYFANFNITFGTDEEPMLSHFEDIIYPAFLSEYKRGKPGVLPQFYFADVRIKEFDGDLVLVGNYIKDTQYDVHTTIQNGELVSTPSAVPTAPYSRFFVFLINHRMLLIKNEMNSPDIRSFQATLRDIVFRYIREINHTREENDRFPKATINIVDIPLPNKIESLLQNVKKINWLKMRFFPLNNDFSPSLVSQSIDAELKRVKSKSANLQINSPESKSEIIKLMQESAGLATSRMEVTNENGIKVKIREDQFTSSTKISFAGDLKAADDNYVISQLKHEEAISLVSNDNRRLYNDMKPVLLQLKK